MEILCKTQKGIIPKTFCDLTSDNYWAWNEIKEDYQNFVTAPAVSR